MRQAEDLGSFQSGTTLEECLARLATSERLEGNNKYNCPRCVGLRPALRTSRLTSLPPVIHFSLLRFVFDQETMTRKKSKASIRYPKEVILSGEKYDLRGVITHQGPSVGAVAKSR